MNQQISKRLPASSSRRDRRYRMQMIMIILLTCLAVSTVVVMGMRHLHQLPARPPALFN